MKDTVTCIICPRGCRMKVSGSGADQTVTGNRCARGVKYAFSESTNPVRTITSTVRIKSGSLPVLPVKTDRPVPKDLIFDCMSIINTLKPEAPVEIGRVLAENILGTGANVVATRNVTKI